MPPILIGLAGLAGTGKDSAADVLVHHAGFTKVAFADALRAEVCIAFNVPLHYLTDRDTKELPIGALALDRCFDVGFIHTMNECDPSVDLLAPRSPHQIMQWWGTEYRRGQSDTYWTDRAMRRIAQLRGRGKPVVLTDVRFTNEADLIRTHGGHVWQITREGIDRIEGDHASEATGADLAPLLVLGNDGDLGDLVVMVLEAYDHTKAVGGAA